jgi:hypothetical protein
MSFKVEKKYSSNSSWSTIGTGYSESQAFQIAEKQKANNPDGFVRITDQKTNNVVATL